MRKKLVTRFPAARIKKIMQVDEEVGKIALSTPLLVSKALELFLQDLLDRTHNMMRERGAKTLSSGHLKQCLEKYKEYDFLKDLATGISENAPETPRGTGPDLDRSTSINTARGRRKKLDSEEPNAEDCLESSQRFLKGKRCLTPDSPGTEAANTNRGLKRQVTARAMEATDVQVPVPEPQCVNKDEHCHRTGQRRDAEGFDLNFDLNASPGIDEGSEQNEKLLQGNTDKRVHLKLEPQLLQSQEGLQEQQGSLPCESEEDYDEE